MLSRQVDPLPECDGYTEGWKLRIVLGSNIGPRAE